MSQDLAVNLNSLALIREELDATLQRAAAEFEAWLLDPQNRDAIDQCAGDIAQIGGTLRLIQFDAAANTDRYGELFLEEVQAVIVRRFPSGTIT